MMTVDAGALPREFGDERIRRGRGEEHRGHDEVALIERHHQERADPRGGRAGLGAERPRDVQRDRKEDAAGARGVRRRHRRHHEIGQHDRVAKPQGAAAEALDDVYAMRSPSRVWMKPRANRNAATISQTVGSRIRRARPAP